MEFNKNTELIQNICLVQIRSIDDVVNIPNLTTIYHTPSSISLTGSTKNTESGSLITKKLSLSFPGLSTTDFSKFHSLVKGAYQVFVKTTTNDIYEIASEQYFMTCSTRFNINRGHTLSFEADSFIPYKYRDNQPTPGINIDGFDYELDFYLS